MKHKLILVCLLLLFLARKSYAQNDKKWAVGPDLYGLINKNILPKYNLFIRYKLGENGAIRVRGGLTIYEIDRNYVLYDYRDEKSYLLKIGYERTQPIYKQSLFTHYGIEYVHSFDYINSWEVGSPVAGPTLWRHIENGGAIFLACRYYFIPALSASVESSLQITQQDYTRTTPGIRAESNSRMSTNLYPISSLNLCFHF